MAIRLLATAPHVVEVREFDPPAVGPTEIRIKTELASGKHGTTQAMFENANFRGRRFDQDKRMFLPSDDPQAGVFSGTMHLGTSAVGTVVEVGREVADFASGDRVVALTRIASENVCDMSRAFHLGNADPLESLCIEPGYVAIHCIREADVRFGDTVAVFGLGAIGLAAVQMARRAGAQTVIGVDLLANRRAWAESHGADAVLDPAVGDVPLRIHELTDGLGTDVTIEVSGSYAALESAFRSTRMRGTVCAAGFYQGEAQSVWFGREFHHNRLSVIVPHGCGWGHEPRDFPRWDERRAHKTMVDMLSRGLLDFSGMIDPLVRIEDAADVFRRIRDDPGSVIKYGVDFT